MKKLKYLFFIILLIIIIPVNVNAKSVKLTCNYIHAYDQLSGNPSVDVKCDIYDDYSHKCYVTVPSQGETNNEEDILNWTKAVGIDFKAKEYVKNYNKCPDYLVVKADKGFDGYQLHAADTEKTASEIQTSLSGKRFIARSKDLKFTEAEIKQAETNINDSISELQSTINDYDLSKCKESDKVITRISECKTTINALRSRLASEIKNVDNFIEQGMFTEDDAIIQEFRAQVDITNSFLDSEQKVLDEEEKKIKEELGLSEDPIGINNGNWNPDKLCANNSCNIDITKFCTDPYVARTLKFLGLLLAIAKVIVPALIIGLGFVDLAKIVISGKIEDAKKQGINIIKRVVIGIVIFIIPTILITIYNVAHSIATDSEEVTSGELNVPTNFKNCVGCILDANNKDACVVNIE